jgi:opacity protein-like surface antigen
MNKPIALVAFVAVALFSPVALAQTKAPIEESLNLSLTKTQAAQVKAAQGKSVTLNLTPAQAKAMRAAFPKWKGSKVTVAAKHLTDKGLVLFYREQVGMNPQPSPYPLPIDLQERLMEANPQPSP